MDQNYLKSLSKEAVKRQEVIYGRRVMMGGGGGGSMEAMMLALLLVRSRRSRVFFPSAFVPRAREGR